MAMRSTYQELLRDPRWQRKRLEVLERAGWQCEDCGAKDQTLHVHHRQYLKDRNPWEYPDDTLQVLCETCHSRISDISTRLRSLLNTLDFAELCDVFCYVQWLNLLKPYKSYTIDKRISFLHFTLALGELFDAELDEQTFVAYWDAVKSFDGEVLETACKRVLRLKLPRIPSPQELAELIETIKETLSPWGTLSKESDVHSQKEGR